MLAIARLLWKRSKEWLFLWKEKNMVRISLSVGHVMNMVIMHLSVLKEKRNLKESLNLEIFCMLMRKRNQIRVEVMMN